MALIPVKTRDKTNFKVADGFEAALCRFASKDGTIGYKVLVSGAVEDKTDGAAVQSFSSEDIFAELTTAQQGVVKQVLAQAEAKVQALLRL